MHMPRWTIVSWLCLFLLRAQEPVPPPATVFSVSTTLVQIDSVVTDSKGHQVTNLKRTTSRCWSTASRSRLRTSPTFTWIPPT
jgi:hypothetical protein